MKPGDGRRQTVTFPPAYSIVLSRLYPPILAMLIALIFRGVAFSSLQGATLALGVGHRVRGGSLIAAFMQGLILGALIEGMPLTGGKYVHAAAFAPDFSMLTGVAVVFGYALLGRRRS